MRTLLTVLFLLSLAAVPAGILLLPWRFGFPVAMAGAVLLQFSHYRLGKVRQKYTPPSDSNILDEDLLPPAA